MDNNALKTLGPGQHGCCFFRRNVQVITTTTAVARALPGRPELHFFFAAGEMEGHLLSLLRAGFQADRDLAGRKLVICPNPLVSGPELAVPTGPIIREVDEAVREHGPGTGVHLDVMMTGPAATHPAAEWFWHLGAFNSYLQQKKFSCMSYYLESSFPPEFVFRCLRIHPLLIAERTAITNPYYMPAVSLAAALGPDEHRRAAPDEPDQPAPLPDQLPAGPRPPDTAYYDLAAITPAPLFHTDARGLISYVNAPAAALLHTEAASLTGLPYAEVLHPADRTQAGQWLALVLAGRKVPPLEVRVHPGTARVRAYAARLEQGSQITWEDLSLQDQLDQLKEQTLRDALTGLYNRQYFQEEVSRFRNPRQWPVSALLIDVDGLKQINDTYGHARGDIVLKRAAESIRVPFREGDVIARIGGDEFAVVLPRTNFVTACARKEEILQAVAAINSRGEALLSLSIGVATSTGPEPGVEELINLADMDMYRVKSQAGRRNHKRDAGA